LFSNRRLVSSWLVTLVVIISVFGGTVRIGAAGGNVEQRIADFWKRVDALQPGDYLSAADLGQWALNVIERNPRARTTVADFRGSTGAMQTGMDRAGLAPAAPAGTPAPSATVEQRIAEFWKRVDALQPTDFLSAADLGQWALNVIDRNPRARTTVADFRVSTADMQGGLDRAGLAPGVPTATPTPAPTIPPVTAAGSARGFLLRTSDLGAGFAQTSEVSSSINEQALLWTSYAPYASSLEMLRAFGFVDSWTRYLYRDAGNGVYGVTSQATMYSSPLGANADYDSSLSDLATASPAYTASSTTVGDRSTLFRRELILNDASGVPVAVSQAYFVFRSGTTSHTLGISAFSGQLDLTAATAWARTQAARSQSIVVPTTGPGGSPTPVAVRTAAPVVNGPTLTTVGGLSFTRSLSAAELYVETGISTTDAISLRTSVDGDISQVQADLASTFAIRPKVYVFTSTSSMAVGLQTIFGYPAATASTTAAAVAGLSLSLSNAVLVNWPAALQDRPQVTVRHELLHTLVYQLAGVSVPAWLNEGLATAEEFTFGVKWTQVRQLALAISMAQVGTALSLADMTDQRTWNSRPQPLVSDQYALAYGAQYLLKRDFSTAAIVRILELLRQGVSFSAAFQQATGQNYSGFAGTYIGRLAALNSSPGILTAADTPLGPGLYIVMNGFTPGTTVSVTIAGPGSATWSKTANSNGRVETYYLRSDIPAGTYTITAVGANGTASTVTTAVTNVATDYFDAPMWRGEMILHDLMPGRLPDQVLD